jgi:mevalonate kinase
VPLLDLIRVFNSGEPAQSTGAVVAAVRARRDADAQGFEGLLGRMEAATRALRRRLESAAQAASLIAPMRDFEACLEAAGVVPPRIREIVREIERRGGAAKISGAGALSGDGAGSLLVVHPDPGAIDGWRFLDSLEPLDVRLGAEGVKVERKG